MAATIEVEIPGLRVVSVANLREHWARKAKRTKAQRGAAAMVLRCASRPPALPVVVTLTRVAPRRLDDDNLRSGFKAVRDGVADWLGCDDCDPGVEWRYEDVRGAVREYGVRITVEAGGGPGRTGG